MTFILDIDQDFFFYPPFFGTLQEALAQNHSNQKLVCHPKTIIDSYNIKGKPYKIFNNHNDVAFDILENFSDVKLIHLDAHRDTVINDDNQILNVGYNDITLANWINYLILNNVVKDIDYIYWGIENNQRMLKTENSSILWSEFSPKTHTFKGPIDYVYYTLSKEWCPPNDLLKEFKYYMIGE